MYLVMMDVGLAEGQIIRITQRSMARIDPGGIGDAVERLLTPWPVGHTAFFLVDTA